MKFCVLIICALVLESFGAVILDNGNVQAEIIVCANANQIEQFAAQELAKHLKLISGKEFSIVHERTANERTPIRIGSCAKLPDRKWMAKNEGRVSVSEDAIDLGGCDEDATQENLAASSGSVRLVQKLLFD